MGRDWSESDDAPTSSRVLNKLDDLSGEVANLRVAMARIEATLAAQAAHTPKGGLARDGAITVSGGAIGSAILFLVQHLAGK
jgi:hypothetical protein